MARGGSRSGAGRPKGSRDAATKEHLATLTELAREHTDIALNALVQVASNGVSENAKVSAAIAILDRGYGKPVQSLEHSGPDGDPIELEDAGARERIISHINSLATRFGENETSSEPE